MRNNHRFTFMNIGSSSLLVIFLALCLATFSVLALSSARSDYTFSKKAAEHREAYYAASNTAEKMLAELDEMILDARKSTAAPSDEGAFTRSLAMQLTNEYTYDTVNRELYFTVPMTDTQVLSVAVRINAPNDAARYTVIRWTVETTLYNI